MMLEAIALFYLRYYAKNSVSGSGQLFDTPTKEKIYYDVILCAHSELIVAEEDVMAISHWWIVGRV